MPNVDFCPAGCSREALFDYKLSTGNQPTNLAKVGTYIAVVLLGYLIEYLDFSFSLKNINYSEKSYQNSERM